ncbi:MAG TPA: hypothetical protein VNF70_02860, partial [Pyrinomonadaceae bacterium]|nr:hypothetical protein [Pyrinomonadaceae bacterium]
MKVAGVAQEGFDVVWKAFLEMKKTGFAVLKVGEIRWCPVGKGNQARAAGERSVAHGASRG